MKNYKIQAQEARFKEHLIEIPLGLAPCALLLSLQKLSL
jgi:hypothetical protein